MKYLAAILLLTLIPALMCEYECGPNELFEECGPHRSCQSTCTFTPELCLPVCLRGCFCKPGFLKRSDLDPTCVRPEEC